MLNVHFLHSQIRAEEKLLIKEFSARDINLTKFDVRSHPFEIGEKGFDNIDLAFERSISYTQGLNSVLMFESLGVNCLNDASTLTTCGDKLRTSIQLEKYKIKQPKVYITYSAQTAVDLMDNIGYPVVLKPTVGSWGRLLAKINDRDSAEAILEHRSKMGSLYSTFYIQEFVDKNNRDIRSFVVGNQCIAAIYRYSDHWITNTARGGRAENCPVSDEIAEISVKAAQAVSNGKKSIVAIDLFETPDGLMVNEVNGTMEFKNSISTTGVNIPARIVDFCIDQARR